MAESELLKQMGKRIFQRRKALSLTQENLAEKLGVSVQMISNLELGKKAIRPENLVKVCQVLEVSADYILTGSITSEKLLPMASELQDLQPDELQLIENMIAYMKRKK